MQVLYTDRHLSHQPAEFITAGRLAPIPECSERVDRFLSSIAAGRHDIEAPDNYGMVPIARIHDAGYLDFLATVHDRWRQLSGASDTVLPNVHPSRHGAGRPEHVVGQAGYYMADTACPITAGTWDAARAAADVAVATADSVLAGAPVAYGLCRPPGHHAMADLAGGFCFLNNVAIAAGHCRDRGTSRVAILDVDVHHGNGTQQIFYGRDDVLFVSLHGDPAGFYPYYSGYADERGDGAGLGFTLNLPLPPGTGDDGFLQALGGALDNIRAFDPGILLVSLGLDAQENDPLGILKVTTAGFGAVARQIAGLALPTILIQEGGYLCDELGANLAAFLAEF